MSHDSLSPRCVENSGLKQPCGLSARSEITILRRLRVNSGTTHVAPGHRPFIEHTQTPAATSLTHLTARVAVPVWRGASKPPPRIAGGGQLGSGNPTAARGPGGPSVGSRMAGWFSKAPPWQPHCAPTGTQLRIARGSPRQFPVAPGTGTAASFLTGHLGAPRWSKHGQRRPSELPPPGGGAGRAAFRYQQPRYAPASIAPPIAK